MVHWKERVTEKKISFWKYFMHVGIERVEILGWGGGDLAFAEKKETVTRIPS